MKDYKFLSANRVLFMCRKYILILNLASDLFTLKYKIQSESQCLLAPRLFDERPFIAMQTQDELQLLMVTERGGQKAGKYNVQGRIGGVIAREAREFDKVINVVAVNEQFKFQVFELCIT